MPGHDTCCLRCTDKEEAKSWLKKTALILVATAKFRKERQLPEASKFIAAITASTRKLRPAEEIAAAVSRTAENKYSQAYNYGASVRYFEEVEKL